MFQFLNKYWPTLRINIFLDAFQGCYKPNRRYFTGVYFIFRLVIFITYALTASELSDMIWKQILCTLMLVIVAILQPYRVNFINYLDILLFLNLSIINAVTISLYSSYTANAHGSYSFSLYLLCVALIWLPLVFILLYVCWHQLKRSRIYRHCIRRSDHSLSMKKMRDSRCSVQLWQAHSNLTLTMIRSVMHLYSVEPKKQIDIDPQAEMLLVLIPMIVPMELLQYMELMGQLPQVL